MTSLLGIATRLFEGAPAALARAFVGRSAFLFAAAVALTVVIVGSGLDAAVRARVLAWNPVENDPTRWPVFWVGFFAPVSVGLALFGRARLAPETRSDALARAILQSVVVVAVLTALLKAITGRPGPAHSSDATEFHLFTGGLGMGGARPGFWPSGHTSSAFAAASAIAGFAGVRRAPTIAALAGALVVAASMVLGSFHWLSDTVAGACIAWPIGWEVGRGFRARVAAPPNAATL
jgi:membrane-associated phospholipid phosphatase